MKLHREKERKREGKSTKTLIEYTKKIVSKRGDKRPRKYGKTGCSAFSVDALRDT